ncbi:unnamed protein product [Arctogadus glacialis]
MEGAVTPWLSTEVPPVRGEANAFPTRGTALLLGSRDTLLSSVSSPLERLCSPTYQQAGPPPPYLSDDKHL